MTRRLILRRGGGVRRAGAYAWYEEREPGLGAEFLRATEASLSSIERDPELYPRAYKRAHRALLRRFP